MGKKAKDLIPPGLAYIADNIVSRQNVLGAPPEKKSQWARGLDFPKESATIFFAGCGYQYDSGLESLMSLLRKMDSSPVGAELPMSIAGFQKKLGIDLAGVYRKLMVREKATDGQPLRDAVNVLKKLDIDTGYLAEKEPCCGGLLHYAGM
ncbi:hypothetical protein ACFLYF_05865, partial [Chloroflexota bacterium]